jgi:hypothetical protein
MRLRIVETTDRQFLGKEIDDSNPVDLGSGIFVFVETRLSICGGIRLVSSTYIIDAEEVPNGQDY